MSKKSVTTAAFSPQAPQDERLAAQAELQQSAIDLSSVIPSDDLRPLVNYFMTNMQGEDQFAKSAGVVVPFPSKNAGKKGVQSVVLDDLNYSITGEYVERPGMMNFNMLRSMVDQTPVLSAVVMTRVRQMQAFCKVQESGFGAGFAIRHANVSHKLTDEERKTTELLQRFFLNTGWEFNPRQRKRLGRQSLRQFIALSVRDSLSMDSTPIETEFKRDKSLGIDGFYAVDGSTIRLCTEEGYKGDDEIFALQVVQGHIRTAYDYTGLIYEPRNPRSDVMTAGYGLSETELLIKVVTGFLNAMTLNIRGFSDNSIPKGVLHLSGNYSDSDLAGFKRYWNGMVKGVNNAWSVPVLVSKDQESKASFENFGVEFSEMMFSKWMTFLTSIICAIYGMSPAEINFDSFSGGNTSPLGGSDTAEKLAQSKDSGLRPLLAYYENIFTDYVLAELGDSYVFRWTGVDEDDQDKRHELKKLTMSVNEMRAELGLEAQTASWGDAPLNPSLIGPWSQEQQAAQQPGPDMQGAEQAPGFKPGEDGQDGAGAGDEPQQGGDGQEQGQPVQEQGQAAPGADPGEDPGEQPMRKSNDIHDKDTGQFGTKVSAAKLKIADVLKQWHSRVFVGRAVAVLPAGDAVIRAGAAAGVDLSEFSHAIDTYAIQHTMENHGEHAGEKLRGQLPVTEDDLLSIPEVVTTPDAIRVGQKNRIGRSLISYVKHMPDGTTILVEEIRTGKKQLALQSLWRYPGTRDADALLRDSELYGRTDTGDVSIIVHFNGQGKPEPLVKAIPQSMLADAAKRGEEEAKPHPSSYGVGIHDEVFFNHEKHGASSGKVLAYGADGFTVDHSSGRLGVPWAGLLGHKTRAERTMTQVESGEGGSIVEDELTGRRHFLAGNPAEMDGEDPELDAERALLLGQDEPKTKD